MPNRFKLLRETYEMTLENVSNISLKRTPFCPISRAAIATWESEKKMPTLDKLRTYTAIFGVSIDWLSGISNIPYTISSIQYAEQYLFDQYESSANGHANQARGICIPYLDTYKEFADVKWDYIYPDDREKKFSLEVRANILLLIGILEINSGTNRLKMHEYLIQKTIGDAYTKEQENAFHSKINFLTKRYNTYHKNLLKLLSTNRKAPIYVIEDAKK